MSNMIPFDFEGSEVRVAIHETTGDPWFVLKDLLTAIETSRTTAQSTIAIEQGLGKGHTESIPLQTAGGMQNTIIISEAAATFTVSRSNTDQGRRLNQKIHNEILPTIRKTGAYNTVKQPQAGIGIPPDMLNQIGLAISSFAAMHQALR